MADSVIRNGRAAAWPVGRDIGSLQAWVVS
jgi:hypothetical protein